MTAKVINRTQRGSAIAEFPVALFFLLVLVLFPMINLVLFAGSMATNMFFARYVAGRASVCHNFDDMLVVADKEGQDLVNSGFGKFAKLKPVGGLGGHGVDLYVYVINTGTNNLVQYGPNTTVAPPIDPVKNVYEVAAQTCYDVGPIMDLSSAPFIGRIPLIGQPARITFTAHRAVEDPNAIVGAGAAATTVDPAVVAAGLKSTDTAAATGTPSTTAAVVVPGANGQPTSVTASMWVDDKGNPGSGFLMTFVWQWQPGVSGRETLTVQGQYMTSPADGAQVTTKHDFNADGAQGSQIGTNQNPGADIAQTTVYTQDIGAGQFMQLQNNPNLTASQNQALNEGFLEMQKWMLANNHNRPRSMGEGAASQSLASGVDPTYVYLVAESGGSIDQYLDTQINPLSNVVDALGNVATASANAPASPVNPAPGP